MMYLFAGALAVLSVANVVFAESNCCPETIAKILESKTLLTMKDFENGCIRVRAISRGVVDKNARIQEDFCSIEDEELNSMICVSELCDGVMENQMQGGEGDDVQMPGNQRKGRQQMPGGKMPGNQKMGGQQMPGNQRTGRQQMPGGKMPGNQKMGGQRMSGGQQRPVGDRRSSGEMQDDEMTGEQPEPVCESVTYTECDDGSVHGVSCDGDETESYVWKGPGCTYLEYRCSANDDSPPMFVVTTMCEDEDVPEEDIEEAICEFKEICPEADLMCLPQ